MSMIQLKELGYLIIRCSKNKRFHIDFMRYYGDYRLQNYLKVVLNHAIYFNLYSNYEPTNMNELHILGFVS